MESAPVYEVSCLLGRLGTGAFEKSTSGLRHYPVRPWTRPGVKAVFDVTHFISIAKTLQGKFTVPTPFCYDAPSCYTVFEP